MQRRVDCLRGGHQCWFHGREKTSTRSAIPLCCLGLRPGGSAWDHLCHFTVAFNCNDSIPLLSTRFPLLRRVCTTQLFGPLPWASVCIAWGCHAGGCPWQSSVFRDWCLPPQVSRVENWSLSLEACRWQRTLRREALNTFTEGTNKSRCCCLPRPWRLRLLPSPSRTLPPLRHLVTDLFFRKV